MKKYILSLLIILAVNFTYGQDFFDAFRYSQTEYGGTARSIAMGSAFGALGGDFVSASINPAGLGFYRSGELTLSPTLNINQIESNYLNNTEIDDRYNFNFNNLSYISVAKTGAETGVVSITFGVGYNRLKNFNSNQYIQGFDSETTLLNYYTDYANQIGNPDNFDYHYEGLAWNAFLIDEDPDINVIEGIYYNNLAENYDTYNIVDENNNNIGIGYEPTSIHKHQQKSLVSRSGRIDEYLFSLGLNINHKIYVGASLGLLDLEYGEKTMFSEIDNNENIATFNKYTQNINLRESGFGFNFKTGIIYRPIKSLRLGFALHTPSFFNISKNESKDISAVYDEQIGTEETGYSDNWNDDNNQYYDYKLETPLKTNFSAAYSIGDYGIISIDYELVNYSSAKFRDADDDYDYSDKNSEINDVFNTTGNLRIGGEYRLTNNFSLRGGYNLISNPWKDTYTFSDGTSSKLENSKDTYNSYSLGFGYRQQSFFIDFAYRMSQINSVYKVHEIYLTNPSNGNALANMKEINNQATVTFGFRF